MKRIIAACSAAFFLSMASLAPAQFIWDGAVAEGGNASWNTAANWVGDVVPTNGASLIIGQPYDRTSTNNFTNYTFNWIMFSNNASDVRGNPFTLSGGLTNIAAAASNQTIYTIITNSTAQTWHNATIAETMTLQSNIVLKGNLTLTGGGNFTFNQPITNFGGSYALIVNTTGTAANVATVTIAANNTYAGGTFINNSNRVNVTVNGKLGYGSVIVNAGGQLYLSGGASLTNAISLAGNGVSDAAAVGYLGALRLDGGSTVSGPITAAAPTRITAYANDNTVNGPLIGSFLIQKTGVGSIQLGNLASTGFTGKWEVYSNGQLRALSDTSLGAVPGAPTADAITLNNGAVLMNYNSSLVISANRGITLGTGGGALRAGWWMPLTVNSAISGANALTIQNDSTPGWITLAGANTFSGNLTIDSRLRLGADEVIPDGVGYGNVTLNPGAYRMLDMAGRSETVNGFSGGGTLTNSTGSSRLTVGNNNQSSAFTGRVEAASSASLVMVKTGTGTLSLSGVLALGNQSGANFVKGGLQVDQGAVYGSSSISDGIGVSAGATIGAGDFGSAGILSTPSTLALTGAVVQVNIGGSNYGTDGDLLAAKDLVLDGTTTIYVTPLQTLGVGSYTVFSYTNSLTGTAAGNLSVQPGATRYTGFTVDDSVPNVITVAASGGAPAVLSWVGTNAAWNLTNSYSFYNTGTTLTDKFYAADTVIFDDTAVTTAVVVGSTVSPETMYINGVSNFTYTSTGGGKISGMASIYKSGTGLATMSLANDFSGMVRISNGVFKIGNAMALGSTVGVTRVEGGTLDINNTATGDEMIYIQGAGVGSTGAVINTSGTANSIRRLILADDAVVGGPVRIDITAPPINGTNAAFLSTEGASRNLIVRMGAAVTNNINFDIRNASIDPALHNITVERGLLRFEDNRTGSGDASGILSIWSGATLDLYNMTNAFTKNITMQNMSSLIAGGGTLTNLNILTGTMTLEGLVSNTTGNAYTLAGTVTGAGGMIKSGAGTVYLTGTNDFSGGMLISAGTINVGKNGTSGDLGTGPVTNNSSTVAFSRTDDYTIGNNFVGTGVTTNAALVKTGSGKLTMTGTSPSYTGMIKIDNGILAVGTDTAIGTTNAIYFTNPNSSIASADSSTRTLGNLLWWNTAMNVALGGDMVFTGYVFNGGQSKLMSISNNLTRFNSALPGSFTGSGTVYKYGPGEVRFENAMNMSAFSNAQGRLTLTGAGAFTNTAAALTFYQGSVFDVAGVTGGWTLQTGQVMRGIVSVVGDATMKGRVAPGFSPGTITYSNNATFNSATLDMEIADTGTVGGGVNDLIEVLGGLTLANVSTVNVASLNNRFASQYTLMTNVGARTGSAANLLLNMGVMTNSRYSFALNDTDANAIKLDVSGSAKSLVWRGTNAIWDVKGNGNWLEGATPQQFYQADDVTFNTDAASNKFVIITNNVSPATLTFDGHQHYLLTTTNSSKITGGASIVKTGIGLATLNLANDYVGVTLISNGTLRVQNGTGLGSDVGATYVAAGGTLDTFGQNLGYEHVYASGSGFTNGGVIVNGAGAQNNTLRRLTMLGDMTIGGTGTWDLRGATNDSWLSTGGNAYNLTKIGTNTVRIVDVQVDSALADINVREGILGIEATSSGLGDPTKTMTVFGGASFWFNSMTQPLAKNIVMRDGSQIWSQGGSTAQNMIVTPVVLSNGTVIVDGGSATFFTKLTGAGSLRKQGGGESWLTGTNDFTGALYVTAGTLRFQSNASALAVSGVRLEGGTLVLDNTRVNLGDRLSDTAQIAGWGGTLQILSATNATTTETLGVLKAERGTTTLNLDNATGATTSSVYLAGIAQDQGMINFTHNNIGTYWFGNTPSGDVGPHIFIAGLTNGATIPYATVNGVGFARYSTANGIWYTREPNEFDGAADQTSQDLKFGNDRNGGANALTGSRAINTLWVNNQADTGIDLAGYDLTLSGGGFRQSGINNFTFSNSGLGGTLYAGDAVFFVNTSTTRLATATSLASLDKEGGGTLMVLNNLSYTGKTGIGGILQVGEGGAASIPTDTPVYNNGTLRFVTTTDHNFTSNIRGTGTIDKYGLNTLTLSGNNNLIGTSFNVYSGTVTFASGSATYMTNYGGAFQIGSPMGTMATVNIEAGALLDLGPVAFYGANFTAGNSSVINLNGGTFLIGATNLNNVRLAHWGSGTASTGTLNIADGLFVVSNRLTLAWDGKGFVNQSNGVAKIGTLTHTRLDNTVTVRTSAWNLVNGTLMLGTGGMTASTNHPWQQFNVSGGKLMAWKTNTVVSQRIPVNLNGSLTIDGVAGDTVEMLGKADGAGGIIKIGAGTAVLAGTNTYLGATIVSNGILAVKTDKALGSSGLVLSGGTLNLSLAGLNEGDLAGSFNQQTNPVGTVTLGTYLANFEQNVSGGTIPPSATAGYKGFLVVDGPTNKTYTFAENFDDSVMLRLISGGVTNTVLNDGTWNNPTLRSVTLAPGIYGFDLRLGNGSGGGGANAITWWTSWTMGFGYDPMGRGETSMACFVSMKDTGDGSLFLSDTNGFTVSNAMTVNADSAISMIGAGGYTMTMSGPVGIGANRLSVTNNRAGTLRMTGATTLAGTPTYDIAQDVTLAQEGAIGGAFGLNKTGNGLMKMTTTNTYTGMTRIMGGALELAVTGALQSTAIQIDSGAKLVTTGLTATMRLQSGQTLKGSGTFQGGLIAESGSTVAPGSSPGILSVDGDWTMGAGSIFAVELNGLTVGTEYDQLAFNNNALTLDGATLSVTLGFAPVGTNVFTIVSGLGATAGGVGFAGLPNGTTFTNSYGGHDYPTTIKYNNTGLGDPNNDITLTVVPEPAGVGVVGLGALALLLRRRLRAR